MATFSPVFQSVAEMGFIQKRAFQHFAADRFPIVEPPPPHDWLRSHFAVGGWSPLRRLSGMLTAHMTSIAPHSGFTWHPHRGLEIYTWVLEGELTHEDTTGGRGVIGAGELQRMFSGDWIEHQELNHGDVTARVIQIWFAYEPRHAHLPPHYQQLNRGQLPTRLIGDATTYHLITEDSPVEAHVNARLTATSVPAGGQTHLQLPRDGEDLFLYVTDGAGKASWKGEQASLGQYDVILATPQADEVTIGANGEALHYLCFYLPRFIP